MDLGLKGRTVVVTGASSGVGLAVAGLLRAEGAHVAACARDADRLRAALDPLPGPGRVFAAAADVRDPAAVEEFVTEAAGDLGGIDGIVANAGRSLMSRVLETTDDQWDEEVRLKLAGVLNPVRAALPWLRRSDAGAVVAVNAILARQPEPRLAATSAARAALLNLATTLSTELAPDGIRVNSVCLGLIDTGQWRRRYAESGSAQDFDTWAGALAADRGVALGRLGTADEVAFPIVSLLSPRSSYVTGATLDVGGGVARYV
ncbi:SDR family oxidoreductase [Pseudonocardia sp. C8]|uniref:SDR family oxidoreductase n=1 Tax=Pseudonocardia sp. C8 TaxID=2762759 RepID=UPI001642ADFD|nr:SDR family oxidoreductase [Pseudonocardia sp. C8]MBC3192934.1 SDR family oxidoreductase [Pseudonocardia sp. C8]